jgi:hypothetical protein
MKLVHEGKYLAQVPVELIDEEGGWSPYLSHEDALKLDQVRLALRNGDVGTAAKFAKVYELLPLTA